MGSGRQAGWGLSPEHSDRALSQADAAKNEPSPGGPPLSQGGLLKDRPTAKGN